VKEIMIDIETLAVPDSLPPGALVEVTEIAALEFPQPDGKLRTCLLYPREGNGLCSADTVSWAMRRPATPAWLDARTDADCPEALPDMTFCLQALTRYIGGGSPVLWAKGAFDFQILEAHYRACGLTVPWEYWQLRDLRTIIKEAGVRVDHSRVAHNALEDCVAQVRQLMQAREKMGISHKEHKGTETSMPEQSGGRYDVLY